MADGANTGRELERRQVLLGVGAVGIAGVLAACGDSADDDPESQPTDPGSQPTDPGSQPTELESPPSESDDDDDDDDDDQDDDDQDDDAAGALVPASDVPVGGGVIIADQGVVVTQPAEGEFRGFSSTCTHQGCRVARVGDGLIQCDCHGSRFSIENGAVQNGPATQPLPEVPVTLNGDQIILA